MIIIGKIKIKNSNPYLLSSSSGLPCPPACSLPVGSSGPLVSSLTAFIFFWLVLTRFSGIILSKHFYSLYCPYLFSRRVKFFPLEFVLLSTSSANLFLFRLSRPSYYNLNSIYSFKSFEINFGTYFR